MVITVEEEEEVEEEGDEERNEEEDVSVLSLEEEDVSGSSLEEEGGDKTDPEVEEEVVVGEGDGMRGVDVGGGSVSTVLVIGTATILLEVVSSVVTILEDAGSTK